MFETVLPALIIWFAALSAAYRSQLLERVLGLKRLTGHGSPGS
jgi:cation-transporting ATPase E